LTPSVISAAIVPNAGSFAAVAVIVRPLSPGTNALPVNSLLVVWSG
jgi:hypothetical protein